MDVLIRLGLFVSLLFVIACNQDKSSSDAALKANDGACKAAEIEQQYIAKWKDGRISKVRASSKLALIDKFIEPNRESLEYVEPDTYIEIPEPVFSKSIESLFVEVNWQHTSMQSQYAWDKNIKGEDVIVAIVDSGADVNHPLLHGQIAVNTGEIANNQIDDDGNGYVDDYYGYDFYRRSGNIGDAHGHGSHVSGIIAAAHTADINLPKGIAPNAKILPLNFMDNMGRGVTSNAILALRYAKTRGAKIVNASWGSADCSLTLKEAILELEEANILVVAAAGNSGLNIDYYPNYPASYSISNMLAVAASTSRGLTADFSNYSINSVHVAAPGKDIYSTTPQNSYTFYSGTSMAAPQVSGLAALVWSVLPNLSVQEVKAAILNGTEGDFYPVKTRGEIDVKKTLQNLGL